MRRVIILIPIFLISGWACAQQSNLDKAEKAINDSFFKRSYKLTKSALLDEKTKKDPLTYYLHAISLYELSKDERFLKSNPEAIKDACSMVLKAKARDKKQDYEGKFDEFIANLVIANNLIGIEEYKVNRYTKAIKYYSVSYSLNGDKPSYFMIGKSYQMAADTINAKFYYKNLIKWYDEAKKSGKGIENPNIDPFIFMTEVYWVNKNYDSANYILDIGRNIFGEKNSKINLFQYLIAKDQIISQPPSSFMMDVVTKALKYSPSDTFLIKKENALALYLIRNAINNPILEVDSMIFRFARKKAAKGNDPAFDNLKTMDKFLQPFAENVLWKMSDYYYTNMHDEAAAYVAKKYIVYTSTTNDTATPTDKEVIDRWIKIINFATENEVPGFVALLIGQAIKDYPNSKELAALKKKTIIELLKLDLKSRDRYFINKIFDGVKLPAIDLKTWYKENLYVLLNSFIAEGNLIKASQILRAEKLKDATDKKLEQIELTLAKENFKINYYNTRIASIKEGTKTIYEYEWDGNAKTCTRGFIPNYIQQKVEDRINYFRVSAGVPPIYLDSQLNDWCQRAALVMESNNKLHHELPKIWSCYSPEAGEAAKFSLLTQNATNTLAVTAFVADQTHPSIGNRRWMLYPFSMVWGHGSTKTKCVLWALDDSRPKDTLYYKSNFIAWPYHGYINKMFVFKKWSFSMNADFKDAQVTMILNKIPINLKIENTVDGYGLPTLAWTPELDPTKLLEGDKIDVTIKLKGNKNYYYTVKIFEFTP